jgi:hypothetical protein
VPLERLYDQLGPVKWYDRRGKWLLDYNSTIYLKMLTVFGERVPPKVTHVWQTRQTFCTTRLRPMRRSNAIWGMLERRLLVGSLLITTVMIPPGSNPITEVASNRLCLSQETADLLAKLDAPGRGGICESDFLRLFIKCECGYIVTRRSFGVHICLGQSATVTATERFVRSTGVGEQGGTNTGDVEG